MRQPASRTRTRCGVGFARRSHIGLELPRAKIGMFHRRAARSTRVRVVLSNRGFNFDRHGNKGTKRKTQSLRGWLLGPLHPMHLKH